MSDSSITRPAGPSGPLTRAAQKEVAGASVKEPYIVPSVPWSISGSYRFAGSAWPAESNTSHNKRPLVIGLPTTASAGTAMVFKTIRVGMMSAGLGGSDIELLLAYSSTVTGGTAITKGNIPKLKSTMSNSVADIRYGAESFLSSPLRVWTHKATAAMQFAPSMYPAIQYGRDEWMDMPLLVPGQYLCLATRTARIGTTTPNGFERYFFNLTWDEVVL